jgi:hypothetical protein
LELAELVAGLGTAQVKQGLQGEIQIWLILLL